MSERNQAPSNMVREGYINKLKGRVYSLLCEYERDQEWESFLDSILVELNGWEEERKTINFFIIWYKLSSSRYLSYPYFRKTMFDVMTLLSKEG